MFHLVKYFINLLKPNRVLLDIYGNKYIDNRSRALEQHVAQNGVFDEFEQINLFITKFVPNDSRFLALDVGANVGLVAFPLSNFFKEVIAFEVDPENAKIFLSNLDLNDSKNVKFFNIGVGSSPTALELCINRVIDGDGFINNGLSSLSENNRKYKKKIIEVNVISLDAFFSNNKIKALNFIKIDTEGFEYEVLKGANDVIQKFRPFIFYESSHTLDQRLGNGVRLKSFDYLTDRGYTHYIYQNSAFAKITRNDLLVDKSDINLFAVYDE